MFVGPWVRLGQILSSSLGGLKLLCLFYFLSHFDLCCFHYFHILIIFNFSVQSLLFQRFQLSFLKINAKLGGSNSMLSIEQTFSNDHRVSGPFNVEKSNASSSFRPFRLFYLSSPLFLVI